MFFLVFINVNILYFLLSQLWVNYKKMRVKVNVNMNMEGSGIRICIYKSIFGIFAKYKEDIGE